MSKLWWECRASICELFISWALKVAPNGYVSSIDQAVMDAMENVGTLPRTKVPHVG